jgi:SAM-dependent methyltransferase
MTYESAPVLGDSRLQSETLESLTSAIHYHAWLTSLASPFLGDDPIELGSGLGDYAQAWLDSGLERIRVTEQDPARLAVLRERFAGDTRVRTDDLDVFHAPSADHSCFVMYNVLEHIEDDVGVLRAARRLVRAGGAVVMFVPAFPFAAGRFDRDVGHVRRYTKHNLRDTCERAGLVVEDIYYLNAPGLLAWFIGMRLLRMTPRDGVSVRLWDRLVVPVARRVESRWRPPFGQSVVAIGRVPAQVHRTDHSVGS